MDEQKRITAFGSLRGTKINPPKWKSWESKKLEKEKEDIFGGSSVDVELFEWIRKHLNPGKILLELGSGRATAEFAKFYKVFSVEHNPKWLDLYHNNYIYVPLQNKRGQNWYDPYILQEKLPKKYDMLLIDGPVGTQARRSFRHYTYLFNWNVPVVFDDMHRELDLETARLISKKFDKTLKIIKTKNKAFGVIC